MPLSSKVNISWETKKYISQKQEAWQDVDTIEVRFFPGATDEEINQEINQEYKATSSYGALRWRSGWKLISIDRTSNKATFEAYTSLCD